MLLREARAARFFELCGAHAEMIRTRYPGALADWPTPTRADRTPDLTEAELRAARFEGAILAADLMRRQTWMERNPAVVIRNATIIQRRDHVHLIWAEQGRGV